MVEYWPGICEALGFILSTTVKQRPTIPVDHLRSPQPKEEQNLVKTASPERDSPRWLGRSAAHLGQRVRGTQEIWAG